MWSLGDDLEAHALEDGAVVRLGVNLDRFGALLGGHADEMADQAVALTGRTSGLAHGYALDDIALQPASCDDVAIVVGDSGIVVHIFQTQTAIGKESLHFCPVGLE